MAKDKESEPGAGRKLLWFLGLWIAGVAVLGLVASLIRWAIL